MEMDYIPRQLCWTDRGGKEHSICQNSLLSSFDYPLVILGEPGIGKTELMKDLGNSDNNEFIPATAFLRRPNDTIAANSLLIIDGLDEVAAMEDGDPLHNALKKLMACGCPPFIVSCRAAEWRGATARADIEQDYGQPPKELRLQPLSEEQAIQVLVNHTNQQKANEAIDSLNSNGLAALFENPLNLKFVAEVLTEQNSLPATKCELLDQAVATMSQEHSQHHRGCESAKHSKKEILRAAGCITAALLITGKVRVAKNWNDQETLSLQDISEWVDFRVAEAALGSRLFRNDIHTNNEPDHFFSPLHRTVAEFLGASWIAHEIETKRHPEQVAQRLLGLLSVQGGFPASLRGLVAWLPKFSPERLGPKVINQDPYGVVRYGDSDFLSENQAGQIIDGLKRVALVDPYFIFDWWEMKPLKGFAHMGLADDIRSIISGSDELPGLTVFLLKAIRGEQISKHLQDEIRAVLFDAERRVYERKAAGITLNNISDIDIDWASDLESLAELGDEESVRLVVELIDEIGVDTFSEQQIASSVAAHTGILHSNHNESLDYNYHYLSKLRSSIPINRIEAILDHLARTASTHRDADEWLNLPRRDEGFRTASSFVGHLICRLVQHNISSIDPARFWNWIRVFWCDSIRSTGDYRSACELICKDDSLRREIQRLALFPPGGESEFSFRRMRLINICNDFELTSEDARIHLSELVGRNNPTEQERWRILVERFRESDDQPIPEKIRKIALPFAEGNPKLVAVLNESRATPSLSEISQKHNKRMRELEDESRKVQEATRTHYLAHADNIRNGDYQWLFSPSKAYLGMFADLETDCEPSERISHWLGEEIKDAVLHGFEAVLSRSDLPTAKEIAEECANSRVNKFEFPMLAAAVERHLTSKSFDDLSAELILSLAILVECQLYTLNQQYPSLKQELDAKLSSSFSDHKKYYQQEKFEIMLAAKMSHVPGLYRFTRDEIECPVSTQICLEWLERFPDIETSILNTLLDSALRADKTNQIQVRRTLAEVATKRLDRPTENQDKMDIWQSIQFLTDFDTASERIPPITENNRDLLWKLTNRFYSRYDPDMPAVPVTVDQLKWIVKKFRRVWPNTRRPKGLMMGTTNPWDASELIEWSIDQIAKEAADTAASALVNLRDSADDGYTDKILSAIARNHQVQIQSRFSSPDLDEVKAVFCSQPPKSPTDVQSIILGELSALQWRLKGDHLNIVNNFYDDNGKPRVENDCRDQMLHAMGNLPYEIKSPTEVRMPKNKRSDGAFIFGEFAVPLETKGQWSKDVWTAAERQLDRYYCVAHNSQSKGIYVVFWFGVDAPKGKTIKLPPSNYPEPKTPDEMCVTLQSLLPQSRTRDVAIVVLDVSKRDSSDDSVL